MPLLRRQRDLGLDPGVATIRLHGREEGPGVEAVTVEWAGDESLFPHLFSIYLDKALANLTKMKTEQQSLWNKVDSLLDALAEVMVDDDGQLDLLPLDIPLVESYPGEPMAEIRVELVLNHTKERYGARTHFRPFLRAQNETIAEVGLWSILQWTLLAMELDKDAFEPVVANLLHQRDYYEHYGLPGIRDIGKAPFYAAMKGAGDRVAAEDAEQAGMSVDEFRALPREKRDRVVRENVEQRVVRAAALEDLAERFRTLWDENVNEYFDRENDRWIPIREAVIAHVSQLDLGAGDVFDKALETESSGMSEEETLTGQLLVHLGLAGYLWREAEREQDSSDVRACRAAYEVMRDDGKLGGRSRKDLLKEFAFWATESYPLGLHGDEELELARDVALDAILEGTGLEDEPLGIPAESADSTFRFGVLVREADDWIPRDE